ncbi:MAG: hypothetical protein H6747_09820 [Deltaproteobacteria bacterium]|nr:hypothetical protein [Deltaproteobacteria bacterium]
MASLFAELKDRLDGLHQQYQLHFAGQPRVTRNPEMMRAMLESARAVRQELAGLSANDEVRQAQALAEERVNLYHGEQRSIVQARSEAGDKGVEASWLGQRANHLFHRYRRHFAGRSRSTRDLALLAEMVRDLRGIRAEMATLASGWSSDQLRNDIGVVDQYLGLFEGEQKEIKGARDAHAPEEAEGIYAQLANDQFELYRLHFAGQPRVSRRPELLERMISTLETILARMEGLEQQGFHGQHNRQNREIVRDRLGQWREEIEAVRKVRSETPLSRMVQELGAAADVVLQLYNERFAGQSRTDRDVDLLVALCDRLWDLTRQMEGLARVHDLVDNERNLEMTYDLLHMMETEHDEIVRAQQGDAA